MKTPYRLASLLAGLALSVQTLAAVTEIHSGGAVYPIVEPDALSEIQAKAETVDFKKIMSSGRENWSAFRGLPLPLARVSRTRSYIPWYALEFDIKDPKGRVMYPKGFRFNPLQYTRLPTRLVIAKIDQFEKLKPLLRPTDMLIADTGDAIQAGLDLGRHVYLAEPGMKERLGVEVVPSLITQNQFQFTIQEIAAHELSD